jgi:hypothetical protein
LKENKFFNKTFFWILGGFILLSVLFLLFFEITPHKETEREEITFKDTINYTVDTASPVKDFSEFSDKLIPFRDDDQERINSVYAKEGMTLLASSLHYVIENDTIENKDILKKAGQIKSMVQNMGEDNKIPEIKKAGLSSVSLMKDYQDYMMLNTNDKVGEAEDLITNIDAQVDAEHHRKSLKRFFDLTAEIVRTFSQAGINTEITE